MNGIEIARIKRLSDAMEEMKSIAEFQIHYRPALAHNNAYLDVEVNIDLGGGMVGHYTHAVEFDRLHLASNVMIRNMLYDMFPRLASLEKEHKAREEWKAVVESAKKGNSTLLVDKDTVLFINDRLAELNRATHGL